MDEQYKKAKDIFLAVCSLDTAEREEALDRECGPDAELRAEVQSLLEHHDVPPTATVPNSPAGGGAEQPDRGPKRVGTSARAPATWPSRCRSCSRSVKTRRRTSWPSVTSTATVSRT